MLGYFGPAGTFTHQALLTLGEAAADARPFPSVVAALDAVRDGQVEAVLVPIENSIEGGVSATLDNLAGIDRPECSGVRLKIIDEVLLPVQFGLYARPGTTLEQVRQVLTHPHAAAQVRGWLHDNLGLATLTEGGSTAGAAEEVARPQSRHDAAVCAQVAGELYGLVPLATEIADSAGAVTRFVLVGRSDAPTPPPTGADRTTVVLFMHQDHPGALLEILEQFNARAVNLTRIESRPTRTTLGSYCFSVDLEGHVRDARVAQSLTGLKRICKDVGFLGSYPRADRVEATLAPGASDQDYEQAERWLQEL